MPVERLRFGDHALGRAFHAAVLRLGPRSPDTGMHGHADYYELVQVRAGRGRHLLPGGTQQLVAGDVVLVRPGDRHALAGLPPDGMEFVNVAFSDISWRTYVDLLDRAELRAWEHAELPPVFHPRGERAEWLDAVFDRTLAAFHTNPSMLHAVRLWTEVVTTVGRPERRPAQDGRPAWLAHAYAAMLNEANMRGGVGRLRELASVSAAHLSRTVRRHYGRTPSQLVLDMRLAHAQRLLATTTEPVTSIAHRCGFASQSYFSRCFQAAEACSPREFRERARRAFVP